MSALPPASDQCANLRTPPARVVDLRHPNIAHGDVTAPELDYETEILEALASAQDDGVSYLLLHHGCAQRRRGETTARALLRALMRGPITWPYLRHADCRQYADAFLAAIRPPPTDAEWEARLAAREGRCKRAAAPHPIEHTS